MRGGQRYLAAVDDLAAHGDWDTFQAALDSYTSCLMGVGALAEALEMVQMRLRAPRIPPQEQGDIVGMFALIYFAMGAYEPCIAVIREAWLRSHPDAPLLIGNSWVGAWAASNSGNWDELDAMLVVSDRMWKDSGQLAIVALASYWAALYRALAREDHAAIEAAAAKLQVLIDRWQGTEDWAALLATSLLAAYRADASDPIVLASPPEKWVAGLEVTALMFFNERGIVAPRFVLDGASQCAKTQFYDCARPLSHVAEAVASKDPTQLVAAIEEVEAHELIPHAARMRIVLAQWTGDRTHLERARPVLERLGDRQFLRRLETVAATLP